jgi:hypothetical protein
MFHSIEYIRSLGYNVATKLYEYKYKLIDSDFRCVAIVSAVVGEGVGNGAGEVAVEGYLIQEYSKRKLNVAANLIRFFRFHEKKYIWPIALQIAWAEKYQPLFTPELKADLTKYLTLI